MGAERGFLSSHTATAGMALVQTSPHIQAVNGEDTVAAGQLMSIDPGDGRAYLCDPNGANGVPAGFAATDFPTEADDTSRITLARQGRIRGFAGLVPGALYYPSGDVPGAVVPERIPAGPVITGIAAVSGANFLGAVTVRAGHRPAPGNWTITFPTATTCTVTPPGGSAGAIVAVDDDSAHDGTIAADFYIETASLSAGDSAMVTVSYTGEAGVCLTPDSPGNAIASAVPLAGAAGRSIAPGVFELATADGMVTVARNGGDPSPAIAVTAGSVRTDIVPGIALAFEAGAITAEVNYLVVSAQEPAVPVGIAVNGTTLQILMGGNG